ncbi:HTH domain-containing protein [Arthrobacter alpinus]|uniref:HTH domain-containing protein n=1 Tax=Arthrobacter alpinus TaxID=656366 RepID=A0A1H5IRD8_9MICC|nr:HTH domain-containing protein [Arthrobacter alpinus]
MRPDRLLSMLLLRQTHGTMAAPRLAAELEVSVRTVYRDMESLSSAGVPVYAERGRNGGISILPDFRTDISGMTPEEAQALFVLLDDTAHTALGFGESLRSALRKLMTALPTSHRDQATRVSQWILVHPSPR